MKKVNWGFVLMPLISWGVSFSSSAYSSQFGMSWAILTLSSSENG